MSASSVLAKESHFLPKYTGYLPSYKYQIGKTYGRHSVEILSERNAKNHRKSVLVPLGNWNCPIVDKRNDILSQRAEKQGNKTLRAEMLPGYTGYIPKNQHYFAKRYGEICRSAICHHEIDQQKNKLMLEKRNHRLNWKVKPDSLTTPHENTIIESKKDFPPLKPITNNLKLKISNNSTGFKDYGHPYSMKNEDEMKWFKTGFTGFIPHSRDLYGIVYKKKCQIGLKKNTDFQKLLKSQPNPNDPYPQLSVSLKTPECTKGAIYRVDRGMLPKYTGYIPGLRFKIGGTYGTHSYNARNLPAID